MTLRGDDIAPAGNWVPSSSVLQPVSSQREDGCGKQSGRERAPAERAGARREF